MFPPNENIMCWSVSYCCHCAICCLSAYHMLPPSAPTIETMTPLLLSTSVAPSTNCSHCLLLWQPPLSPSRTASTAPASEDDVGAFDSLCFPMRHKSSSEQDEVALPEDYRGGEAAPPFCVRVR